MSDNNSKQKQPHSKFITDYTSLLTERLTPSEIEALRQHARESDEYFKKAFADLRPAKKEGLE